jgi:hypothetical protein
MTIAQRIEALAYLGSQLHHDNPTLQQTVERAAFGNIWFTQANIWQAIDAIRMGYLDASKLTTWIGKYTELTQAADTQPTKIVALILAGNIPLVGVHDVLCVFMSGHRSLIKLSEKDAHLFPLFIQILHDFDARTAAYFQIADGFLKDFDAVIATGSNNSARYFEAYFGKYPHIIRKNRNAVAVLSGQENAAQLDALGKDVYTYFGLGCRNVSKLYLPRDYDFVPLLEALHEYREMVLHNAYKNNFDHNYALLILNRVDYKANGCILMTENTGIASPIACLYYEYYDDVPTLERHLTALQDQIQLIVSAVPFEQLTTFDFGEAQQPSLLDYADGVDTMTFLIQLNA